MIMFSSLSPALYQRLVFLIIILVKVKCVNNVDAIRLISADNITSIEQVTYYNDNFKVTLKNSVDSIKNFPPENPVSEDVNLFSRSVEKESLTTLESIQSTLSNEKPVIIYKCCPLGQNLSMEETNSTTVGHGNLSQVCANTMLKFKPKLFYSNRTYARRIRYATVVGNPCKYGKYLQEERIFLYTNGSLLTKIKKKKTMLPPGSYCMESTWNSLKSFTAAYICFEDEDKTVPLVRILTVAFSTISIPCLAVVFAAHVWIKELRSSYSCSLAILSACMLTKEIMVIVIGTAGCQNLRNTCSIVGYIIHFGFLLYHFWFTILCYENYRIFKLSTKEYYKHGKNFNLNNILICVTPMFIIIIVAAALGAKPWIPIFSQETIESANQPQFNENTVHMLVTYYGPVGISLIIDIVLLVRARISNLYNDKSLAIPHIDRDRTRVVDCIIGDVFITLGWLLEMLSWIFQDSGEIRYVAIMFIYCEGTLLSSIFLKIPMTYAMYNYIKQIILCKTTSCVQKSEKEDPPIARIDSVMFTKSYVNTGATSTHEEYI